MTMAFFGALILAALAFQAATRVIMTDFGGSPSTPTRHNIPALLTNWRHFVVLYN